jgi:hypothetical protein
LEIIGSNIYPTCISFSKPNNEDTDSSSWILEIACASNGATEICLIFEAFTPKYLAGF